MFCCMLFSGKKHIDVLSHCKRLAIIFVIHLNVTMCITTPQDAHKRLVLQVYLDFRAQCYIQVKPLVLGLK